MTLRDLLTVQDATSSPCSIFGTNRAAIARTIMRVPIMIKSLAVEDSKSPKATVERMIIKPNSIKAWSGAKAKNIRKMTNATSMAEYLNISSDSINLRIIPIRQLEEEYKKIRGAWRFKSPRRCWWCCKTTT